MNQRLERLLPRTLTARLVVTAVALVALVGILVAASATIAMRSYLTNQLDGRVRDALERADRTARGLPDGPGDGADRSLGQIPGTLSVIIPADSSVAPVGGILTERLGLTSLPTSTVTTLRAVDSEVNGRTIKISGTTYRFMLREDSVGTRLVVGLPTSDVDHTINSMLTWFALLTFVGLSRFS